MNLANRLAISVALLGLVALVLAWLIAIGWLPNLRSRDQYGPTLHYGWAPDGKPRPIPHLLPFKVAPSRCGMTAGAEACLRSNWSRMLDTLGEPALGSGKTDRSYRLLELVACQPPVSIRLDVGADGTGRLVSTRAPSKSSAKDQARARRAGLDGERRRASL
jgi:hypothetical protein